MIMKRARFGYGGEKNRGNRTCNSGREKDEGERHSIQDAVKREGMAFRIAKDLQHHGNRECFQALEQI